MSFKVVVVVCLCIVTAAASRHVNFYRRDYTYFEEYDAFYKLHWGKGEKNWQEGYLTCDDEGAQLFYPANDEEWRVAANLTESVVDLEHIYVGVHDEFGRGDFLTTDGRFIPDLSHVFDNEDNTRPANFKCGLMSVKTGTKIMISCELRRPFICKKLNNEICPTADSDYFYSKRLKKCFKFNKNEKTWANAMHTCIMEGGVLSDSIINTDINNLNTRMRQTVLFIGFRSIEGNNIFYSNRGLKITLSRQNNYEHCATVTINNEINTSNCEETRPFICEMEVNK
uniref:C-type lectin domain-containing protein n=1 Tax=Papilio xuthus TaxID=66420 RepID=I4DIP1_PAPXU|nr:unknown secreted protein [Papilio xuthus]